MKTSSKKNFVMMVAALATVFSMAAFTLPEPPAETDPGDNIIRLVFVDHLKAGLIEQDVFVEKEANSGQVFRVLPGEEDAFMNTPVYGTAQIQKHNPFNAELAGPYQKGKALDMTLADWLKAEGTAAYSCEDGWGNLTATFKNLVPNATYTMWHFFMAKGDTQPFVGTLDIPVGARDGSETEFTTDKEGNASINVRFETCLQLGQIQLASGLAVAWHSDGKTYKSDPGPFGQGTHVQLFAMLPDAN